MSVLDPAPLDVLDAYRTCEFATLGRDGTPLARPTAVRRRSDGTLLPTTSLAFAQKALNVRRDGRVALLFSDSTGSGHEHPPQIFVDGRAVCPDTVMTGPQGAEDYWRTLFERQPHSRAYVSAPMRPLMDWYYLRLLITVTPEHTPHEAGHCPVSGAARPAAPSGPVGGVPGARQVRAVTSGEGRAERVARSLTCGRARARGGVVSAAMRRTLVIPLLAVALTGCSQSGGENPCTMADAESRISVMWRPADFGDQDAVTIMVCVNSTCKQRTSGSPDDPLASLSIRLSDNTGASTLPVRLMVMSTKNGDTVVEDSTRARLTEQHPNGPSCTPAVRTATFRAHPGKGLVPPEGMSLQG
ncbi:hypothetical protein [Streptomyces adustus]